MDPEKQSTIPAIPTRSYSQIACVGTGFSGIGVGATLKRWYNITDVQFFDRASSSAGTWTNNSYPGWDLLILLEAKKLILMPSGCACDIPAALYSLSYEQNPNWTRLLAKQPEIKAYLQGVADKYDLTRRMHFSTEVNSCTWNESTSTWILQVHDLTTNQTYEHECQILFQCAGGLVTPKPNEIPGASSFKGPRFHTARWNHDVDLKNKSVAVIGNGCTGVQVVPALVDQVGANSVKHFVRSKHWIVPGQDRAYPPFLRWIFKNIPGALQLHRFQIFYIVELDWPSFYTSPSGQKANAEKRRSTEQYMSETAPEKYRDILIPDWAIGCRRRIFDPGYLKSLHNPKISLTNDPILEITPDGVRTASGVHPVDAIVEATGFDLRIPLAPMKVTGRDGRDLFEQWQAQGGAGAYSCVAANGFPNMFFIAGPNSATGHNSVVLAAENTTNLSIRVAEPVLAGRATTVEVTQQAEEEWTHSVQESSKERVWTQGGCQNWYVADDTKGRGQKWVSTLYPFSQTDMWRRCTFPEWKSWDYRTRTGVKVEYQGDRRLERWRTILSWLIDLGPVVWTKAVATIIFAAGLILWGISRW